MDTSSFDVVVVGSGFFGATIAERSARVGGLKVCILEQRKHIGGNSYSEVDTASGIEYHKYGSHLFHTNSEAVWNYIKQFAKFSDYRHQVFTIHNGQVYSMPINLATICSFFGRYFTPGEARTLIEHQVAMERLEDAKNLEDKAISLIGRPLYEAFIRDYTVKQWQTDPRKLPGEIIMRLPVRFSFDDRYFSDTYQGLPLDGYTSVFQRMLTDPRIDVRLACDFFAAGIRLYPHQLLVYTGPIDRFFTYKFGPLGWRTLDFEFQTVDVGDFQGTAVMNYADASLPYTRVHEFRHLHPERKYQDTATLIAREYSRFAGHSDEVYYPINTRKDKDIYNLYRTLAQATPNIIFGGRLGTYRYLDMHQAIGAALKVFDARVMPFFLSGRPAAPTA